MELIKISELPDGMIIWFLNDILGITGSTLPDKYYDMLCRKIIGNKFDYELVVQ